MRKECRSKIPSGWSEADLSVEGMTIHYYRTAPPRPAATLLLLHGATDNGLCWMRLALALQSDYDLIMPDARGHGLSSAPHTGYGSLRLAADALAVARALSLDSPILIGHSLGAETAALAASMAPGYVRGLVLEDPPWFDKEGDPYILRRSASGWRTAIEEQQSKPLQQLIATGRAENPAWDSCEWEPWAESKHQVTPDVSGFVESERPHWSELVGKISCPLLLITGDNGKGCLVSPAAAAKVRQKGRDVTIMNIGNAGHSIRRDQFDEYLGAVTAFLHRLRP